MEGLIRWSTPLMARGPDGDRFHTEWLIGALRALLTGKTAAHQAPTAASASKVGIAAGDRLRQLRATGSGVEVTSHDGGDLDAVVRADASIVLGLAAGALTLDDIRGLIDIEGDENAARSIFLAHRSRRHAEPQSSPTP